MKRIEILQLQKPGCKGCIHQGPTFPCEYILNTGRSPRSQGVKLNPRGKGGCPLKDRGKKAVRRIDPVSGSAVAQTLGRPFSAVDDERAMALYRQGLTIEAMARELGISGYIARRWLAQHELRPNAQKRSGFDAPEIVAAYRAGASDTELGKLAGMTRDAARRWRKARGLPPNFKRGSH